jgi:hypothetical protein
MGGGGGGGSRLGFIIFTIFFSSIVFCSTMTDLINITKYHKA